ncbi:Max-binding protein MNT [Chionoecetes opilio]|uniref:Max-binding protein MNT n=1 Tax=Chionoecetes opilio TaxID=41210 RepID=A0A8J4XNU1_CHIOP|nr:Max-binding protein MNT [Chionoecetes opilio]
MCDDVLWVTDLFFVADEGGEEGGDDEGVKREAVLQRVVDNLPRAATTIPNHHPHNSHHHNHHHHHHHHSSNHRGVGPNSPPPAPRTAPTSPAHAREEPPHQRRVPALSTPTLGVRPNASGQQQAGAQHHTSPRTSLSYPGSPATSPSPLGLLSVFRQESSSPPSSSSSTGDPSSLPSRLGSDTPHHQQQHQPGTHHNGLAKSLSLSPAHHSSYSHHGLYSPDDPAFKDDKNKRSGTTPSREVHNKLEKNRRAHLKECFETLRRQLPSMDDKKISNQTILKAAHKHIQVSRVFLASAV